MLIDSYLIQQRANVFRRGYRNWRQFATKRQQHNAVPVTEIKGAEGEVMDIATGVITVPAQPVEPLGNRNLDMKLPLARSRDSLSAGLCIYATLRTTLAWMICMHACTQELMRLSYESMKA